MFLKTCIFQKKMQFGTSDTDVVASEDNNWFAISVSHPQSGYISDKLLNCSGRDQRRALFSLKQIFQVGVQVGSDIHLG